MGRILELVLRVACMGRPSRGLECNNICSPIAFGIWYCTGDGGSGRGPGSHFMAGFAPLLFVSRTASRFNCLLNFASEGRHFYFLTRAFWCKAFTWCVPLLWHSNFARGDFALLLLSALQCRASPILAQEQSNTLIKVNILVLPLRRWILRDVLEWNQKLCHNANFNLKLVILNLIVFLSKLTLLFCRLLLFHRNLAIWK